MPLIIFYYILSSYEEIFVPLFSGGIYVFLKWFYSKDFMLYIRREETFVISKELELSNAIKSSNITILIIAINLSAFIKKKYESQFLDFFEKLIVKIKLILPSIFDRLVELIKFNLSNSVISNLFAVVLVTILFFVIKIIIYKKGVSIIEKYKTKQEYRIENSN